MIDSIIQFVFDVVEFLWTHRETWIGFALRQTGESLIKVVRKALSRKKMETVVTSTLKKEGDTASKPIPPEQEKKEA